MLKKVTRGALLFVTALAMLTSLNSSTGTNVVFAQENGYLENGIIDEIDFLIIDDLFECEEFVDSLREEFIAEFGEIYVYNQDRAVRAVDELMASLPRNRIGDVMYPEFWGGIYINDDGNLVVQLVPDMVARSRSAADTSTLGLIRSLAEIEYVSYSYNYLVSIVNTIVEFLQQNPDHEVVREFYFLYTDIIENTVVVELTTYSDELVSLFRDTIVDSSALFFKPAPPYIRWGSADDSFPVDDKSFYEPIQGLSSITVGPGRFIGTTTMGYRANINGVPGMVVSAHPSQIFLGAQFSGVGTVIGFVYSGTVDAAFIQTNANVNVINNIIYRAGGISATAINPESVSATVGMDITKFGNATGRLQNGRVTAVNGVSASGRITGLVITNASGQPGDSGGPVFRRSGNNLTGIVQGGHGSNMLFVRESNIRNALRANPF